MPQDSFFSCVKMRRTFILYLLSLSFGLLAQTRSVELLRVSVPENSGITSVDYTVFIVTMDSLLVYKRHALDTMEQKVESYWLAKEDINGLIELIKSTDSLGSHIYESFYFGCPRFFISINFDGKHLHGFIANCYREHIFVFIDWLNDIYSKEIEIEFNKEELVASEGN